MPAMCHAVMLGLIVLTGLSRGWAYRLCAACLCVCSCELHAPFSLRYVIPVEPDGVVLNNYTVIVKDGLIVELLPHDDARAKYKAKDEVRLACLLVLRIAVWLLVPERMLLVVFFAVALWPSLCPAHAARVFCGDCSVLPSPFSHSLPALLPSPQQFLGEHTVMPGMVNAHTHVSMNLLRGIADDLPLIDWLTKEMWPTEARLVSPEFVKSGARHAIAELIRGGTTCFNDMYFFPDAVADVRALVFACAASRRVVSHDGWVSSLAPCRKW